MIYFLFGKTMDDNKPEREYLFWIIIRKTEVLKTKILVTESRKTKIYKTTPQIREHREQRTA